MPAPTEMADSLDLTATPSTRPATPITHSMHADDVASTPAPAAANEAKAQDLLQAVDALKARGCYVNKYTFDDEPHNFSASCVVAFATSAALQKRVALKFFLSSEVFRAELEWCRKAAARRVLSQLVDVVYPYPGTSPTSITWYV